MCLLALGAAVDRPGADSSGGVLILAGFGVLDSV